MLPGFLATLPVNQLFVVNLNFPMIKQLQVCCWVYELLHFKHGDATQMVHTLDIPWYFVYRKSIFFKPVVEEPENVKFYVFDKY